MTQDHSFQNPTQAGQPRSADIPSGGSYGQGGTGSYQSGVYQPSAQGQSSTSVSDGRQLVIGQGITMSGEIEACENLVVEGTVEAALKGARVLEITETGVFYGAVEIEEATIAGRFEGDITVNGKLTVLSTGMITGSIVYKDLAVDAGAVIDGKISPLSAEGAAKGTKGDSRKASVKSKISKSSSANESGSELPFSGSTAVAAE